MPFVQEQVEAARKGLDQAKEEGLKLHASSDDDDNDFLSPPASAEPVQPTPARRGRKPKDKNKIVTSTRMSGRLRGASPETEPEPTTPREVPDRLRLGLRGRGTAKDSSVSTTQFCTDQHKTSSSYRLQDSSKSSATASSPASDHPVTKSKILPNRSSPMPSPPLSSPSVGKYQSSRDLDSKSFLMDREVERRESERRVSESSVESSCIVDNHTKDEDIKDHSAMSPPSRSPRKRQSADNEVLRGLVEDSPSAKVLRKLPGRLVTVVEEKEPRKRRRRGSGTGGEASTEEVPVGEDTAGLIEESNKDNMSADRKTREAINSSKDQDSNSSLHVQPMPVRSYPPYSPPHLSPDMPVLRNLPVRRRLETESRLAAQLGEQQQHTGRGRGSSQPRKTEALPGRDHTSSSTDSSVNPPVAPVKRKRGRPPKNPPKVISYDIAVAPPTQLAKPVQEANTTQIPKRKRGRPRTTPLPENVRTDASKISSSPAQTRPPPTPVGPTVTTSEGLQVAEATKEDTKPEIAAPSSTPAQTIIESDQTSTPVPASDIPVPATDQSLAFTPLLPSTVAAFSPAVPVTSTPVISQSSSPPVEEKPVASTTVKTPPESTQATTAATPAPSSASTSVSSVKTVPTPVPVTSVTTVTESLLPNTNIPSSATTTAKTLQQPSASSSTPVDSVDQVSSTATPAASATSFCPSAETQMSRAADMSTEATSLEWASISSSATPTCAPAVAQKATAASLSTALTQSTSTSVPSTSQTLFSPCPTMYAGSTASTISSSAMDTTLSSPADTNTGVTAPKASLESASTISVEIVTERAVKTFPVTGTSAASGFCNAPPSAPSANVTTTSRIETVTGTTSPALDTDQTTPSKQFATSGTPTTDVEKPAKIPHSVLTSMVPTPVTESVPVTTSPEKAVRGADIATNTQLSLTEATPVAAFSTVPQGSAPSGVSPEESTPAQMDVQFQDSAARVLPGEEEAFQEKELEISAKEARAQTCEVDDKSKPQCKRRRVGSSSEDKEQEEEAEGTVATQTEPKQTSVEQSEGQKPPIQKRPLSRQSSQESTCSSSPSSGCSTSNLTRQAHHKKTYEHRLPNKKRRIDVTSDKAMGEKKKESMENTEEGGQTECCTSPPRRRRSSRSSSSSSDSDDSEGRKEQLLARSSKHRLQSQEMEKGSGHQGKKRTRSSERNASNNTSTAGESGSDTSSVRTTRKSVGSQVSQGSRASTNSASSLPPEPEVLGKRCSALNAAAKLQAMKGRVDTPGHTLRKDPGAKAAGTTLGSSSDKNQKPKSKSMPATSQANSLNSNKSNGKPSTPSQTSRSAPRSTRQCPGSLAPPLELEYKRSKQEEKERRGRKSFGAKEGEAEAHSSSRGHSACSSMSSDGEGDGGRSSRSRSSSNSSQRTHSISSQNTEHRESRAASSGSERSTTQTRKGRLDNRRSQRLSQEVSSSSGTEGTPDRVLRSVTALAAVHARSPAESTRSSSGQHRLNKT